MSSTSLESLGSPAVTMVAEDAYGQQTVAQVVRSMGSDALRGLSRTEATRRLQVHGPNRVRVTKTSLAMAVCIWLFRVLAVLIAIVLTLAHYENTHRRAKWSLALVGPLGGELIWLAIVAVCHRREGRSAEQRAGQFALGNCMVIREGVQTTVPRHALVPGDLVVLQGGDEVPADGRIVEANSLTVNRQILSGSAESVALSSAPATEAVGTVAARNMALAHSLVVTGTGVMVVTATGTATAAAYASPGLTGRHIASKGEGESKQVTKRLRRLHQYGLLAALLIVGVIGAVRAPALDRLLFAVLVYVLFASVPRYSAWAVVTHFKAAKAMTALGLGVTRPGVVLDLGQVTTVVIDRRELATMGLMQRMLLRVYIHGAWLPPSALPTVPAGDARDEVLVGAWAACEPGLMDLLDSSGGAPGEASAAHREQYEVFLAGTVTPNGTVTVVRARDGDAGYLVLAGTPSQVLPLVRAGVDGSPPPPLSDFAVGAAGAASGSESSDDAGAGAAHDHWLRCIALRRLSAADFANTGLLREQAAAPASGLLLAAIVAFSEEPCEGAADALQFLRDELDVDVLLQSSSGPGDVSAAARALSLPFAGHVRSPVASWFPRGAVRGALPPAAHYALATGSQSLLDLVLSLKANGSQVAFVGCAAADAPAMAMADVGILLARSGAAPEHARQAAKAFLRDDSMQTLIAALVLARGERMRHTRVLMYLLTAMTVPLLLPLGLYFAVGLPLPLTPLLALGLSISAVAHAYGIAMVAVPDEDAFEPRVIRLLDTAQLRPRRTLELELLNTREIVRAVTFSLVISLSGLVAYVVALSAAGAPSSFLSQTWTQPLTAGPPAAREWLCVGATTYFAVVMALQIVAAWSMRLTRLTVVDGLRLVALSDPLTVASGASLLAVVLAVYVPGLRPIAGTGLGFVWVPMAVILGGALLVVLEFMKAHIPTRGALAHGPVFERWDEGEGADLEPDDRRV